jgi:hypothetical protein
MKTIVRILTTAAAVMMFANFASAQDYTQDFCEGASDPTVQYQAGDLESGSSVILWTMEAGGGVLTNETSATCDVDWTGVTPGTYTITLRETHSSSLCFVEKTIDVTIHAKPTANFALTGSTVCNGEDANILVNISSTADWSLVYNDGSSHTVTGTAGNNYTISALGVGADVTYTLVSIENDGCTLAAGDDGTITTATHDLTVAVLNPTITVIP